MKKLQWAECVCGGQKVLKDGLKIKPCKCGRARNARGEINSPSIVCFYGTDSDYDQKSGTIRYAGNAFAGNLPPVPSCYIVCAGCNAAMGKPFDGFDENGADKCARVLAKRWNEVNS